MLTAARGESPANGTNVGVISRIWAKVQMHASSIAALVVRVAAAGLAYLLQIVLARLLGADDYGVFAYAWAWVTIGGFAATFGFGQISVRFLAQYSERGESALALGFIRMSLLTVGGGTLAIAIGGLYVTFVWPEAFSSGYFIPMVLALAAFPLFALGDLAEGFARSQGWSVLALAPPYIVRQSLLLIAIPAIYLLGIQPNAGIAMFAAFIATTVTALVQLVVVLKCLLANLPAGQTTQWESRAWASAAWPVFLADLAQVLRQNVDLLVLAIYAEPAEIAVYYAATRVASMLGLIEFAVGAAAAHRFARVIDATDITALRKLAREAAMVTFWPTLIGGIVVSLLAPFILSLFGDAYAGSAPLVAVLAIGFIVRSIIGPAEEFLTMRGHGRSVLLAQVLGLEATASLCWMLTPTMGATGAALGSLGALCVTTAVLAICCDRQTGVLPLPIPAPSLPSAA